MRTFLTPFVSVLCIFAWCAQAENETPKTPTELLTSALQRIVAIVEPGPDAPRKTFVSEIEFVKTEGLPKALADQTASIAFQGPDHLKISAHYKSKVYSAGRNGQQVWFHVPDKKFGVVGKRGESRFATAPEKKDATRLGPMKLPISADKLALIPLLMNVQALPEEKVGASSCFGISVTPKPEAIEALKIPNGLLKLWLRTNDYIPLRIAYSDAKKLNIEVQLHSPKFVDPWAEEEWRIPAGSEDKVETTALGHLTRFISVAISGLNQKIPTLPPATGDHRLVATEGAGRFEMHDGTRVLLLQGTPEEMGRQQGVLLKKEIKDVLNKIVYGVGVGSSFPKGRWFFGEIEHAQSRINPFIDSRYLREMDAIAMATGHEKEEIRLANFFPELFHCSGFAIFGEATLKGTLYHGRILDYLRGMGLEQNAVVTVYKPDQGHSWVNVTYAGFVGSVTGMNDKKVAIGEMGGRGEGNWDGKPMAQLVREVMEKAATLEEAIEIMRKGPRTCEYYYVISDGKTRNAVGIAATPDKFETVFPGQTHERLPHAVKDAVILSAGDRYEKLTARIREEYGEFDADSARDLMKRPVCMPSNIHSVLFAPETLDFWVANADSQNPASHTRYTKYNLAELLKSLEPGSK